MAKQRHNQPPPEPASRAPLAMMAIGALLVAGLIVWALTRTVETTSPTPSVSSTITPSTDTTASLVPPVDTTVSVVPPAGTVANTTTSPTTIAAPSPTAMQGDKKDVPRIAAEDLREKTKANSVMVIDVRDANSYASGHIPGALHIQLATIEANLDRIPKNREIVTYCT
ncbi:MAG: rhodanese-like domain-containing protein [Thermoanaerobaculia bacterium]